MMRNLSPWTMALVLSFCYETAFGQSPDGMKYRAAANANFSSNPSLPTCGAGAVQDGNPGNGPSVILIKFKPGCIIPWHWHTPNERIIVISGSARAEMKSMTPTVLKSGDFLLLPAKQIHKFVALTSVEIFDISDAPFDIHYVDAAGKEISPATALNSKQATNHK